MAQIFISHSAKDQDLVTFFSKAGATTKVKLVFEEFEKLTSGPRNPETIKKNIEFSNALFVLLSNNVNQIPHTRDWILWESGVGHNKDIWVFERHSDSGQISVAIPFLRNYVVFEPNDSFMAYLMKIFESYDDSNVLGTVLASALVGASFGGPGAVAGSVAGLFLSNKASSRPAGLEIRCIKCSSSYRIHLPASQLLFRCPVCNSGLRLPPAA